MALRFTHPDQADTGNGCESMLAVFFRCRDTDFDSTLCRRAGCRFAGYLSLVQDDNAQRLQENLFLGSKGSSVLS
jgi:hypothetical protein